MAITDGSTSIAPMPVRHIRQAGIFIAAGFPGAPAVRKKPAVRRARLLAALPPEARQQLDAGLAALLRALEE